MTLLCLPWTILAAVIAALVPDPFDNEYARRQIEA